MPWPYPLIDQRTVYPPTAHFDYPPPNGYGFRAAPHEPTWHGGSNPVVFPVPLSVLAGYAHHTSDLSLARDIHRLTLNRQQSLPPQEVPTTPTNVTDISGALLEAELTDAVMP